MFRNLPSNVARLFNVRFAITTNPEESKGRMSERLHVEPRAYLVSDCQLVETDAEALSIVSQGDFNPLERVILEEPLGIELGPRDSDSRVLGIRTSINEIEISYRAASPKFLVLSEQYYPGWKATLDSNPVRIYRADYLLRAVEAPAGTHTVRFYFQPLGLRFGLPVSLLTLAGIVATLILFRRRKPARRAEGREAAD
jgi:hypothetical protein